MGILTPALRGAKNKKSKPSPYDWSTLPSDPLKENPGVLSALVPWQQSASALATSTAARLGTPDTALYDTLKGQAQNELALGGDLTPDEVAAATQAERASWQARGMAGTPAAGFSEVLRRLGMATARRRERQAFASGVQDMGLRIGGQNIAAFQAATGAGNEGNQFAEDIRRFGVNRYDTRQFNKNSIEKDLETAKMNAQSAASAAKKSATGSIIGAGLGLIGSFL